MDLCAGGIHTYIHTYMNIYVTCFHIIIVTAKSRCEHKITRCKLVHCLALGDMPPSSPAHLSLSNLLQLLGQLATVLLLGGQEPVDLGRTLLRRQRLLRRLVDLILHQLSLPSQRFQPGGGGVGEGAEGWKPSRKTRQRRDYCGDNLFDYQLGLEKLARKNYSVGDEGSIKTMQ